MTVLIPTNGYKWWLMVVEQGYFSDSIINSLTVDAGSYISLLSLSLFHPRPAGFGLELKCAKQDLPKPSHYDCKRTDGKKSTLHFSSCASCQVRVVCTRRSVRN